MDLLKTRFTELMVEANSFASRDFAHWLFCPGMLFHSPDKWWGDRGQRDFPHEGLDFCLYQEQSGKIMRLDPNTRIPAMQDGVVRAMFADYLGRALIVEHVDNRNDNKRWLSVYAHTKPLEAIVPGVPVKQGTVIATIADTSHSKAGISPHLHVSLGVPSVRLSYERFVWNRMRDSGLVALLDPIAIVEGRYKVLENCPDDQMLG
jgi:murein DD-endopeptidase MepM/ murein hydrolase activator NlpD